MEESHTYFQFVSVNKYRSALLPKGGRISTLRGGGQDSRVYFLKKKKKEKALIVQEEEETSTT